MVKKLKYDGWLKIYEVEDTNKNGVKIKREIMSRASGKKSDDSVAGLLIDKGKQKLYFVKQYRAGVNEEDRYLLEVVAGTLEVNEDPKECFKREALEEVGFECEYVESCGTYYTSPGGTTEMIHLFIGYGERTQIGGGLETENEDIEIVEFDSRDFLRFFHIRDLKTEFLLNYYLSTESK